MSTLDRRSLATQSRSPATAPPASENPLRLDTLSLTFRAGDNSSLRSRQTLLDPQYDPGAPSPAVCMHSPFYFRLLKSPPTDVLCSAERCNRTVFRDPATSSSHSGNRAAR